MNLRTIVLVPTCLAILASAYVMAQKHAEDYYQQAGMEKLAGEVDQAIADYNRALKLKPDYASAYERRGEAKKAKGDYEGALADFEVALKTDPKLVSAYYHRGIIKGLKGDLAGALADYEVASQLDPEFTRTYFNKGIIQQEKGDLERALAEFRSDFELDPNNKDYASVRIWLVRAQKGERDAADSELLSYLAARARQGRNPSDWMAQISRFLLGQITEDELSAAAASPYAYREKIQRCEFWYYVGMKQSLQGDVPEAIRDFRNCVATGSRDESEFDSAQREILGAGK